MTDELGVPRLIRDLTDDEINHYHEKGWVFAKNYVDPDHIAQMLARAKARINATNDRSATNAATDAGFAWWHNLSDISGSEVAFSRIGRSPDMGRNVARLFRRDTGVRYWVDALAAKFPFAWGGTDVPTTWHQDAAYFPLDRCGTATCWIALDSIVPEQGAMRFMEGTHRREVLGHPNAWTSTTAIFERYPWLKKEHAMSPPLTYEPGDATFHHSVTVHGGPANSTDRIRWNYAISYMATDCLYNGADCPNTNGLELALYAPIENPAFPLVWPRS